MAEFNAFEIYMLQLVNRARLDPSGEAARYGIDLNQGLAAGTISATPKQPLVPNPLLNNSARAHSQWMLDTDIFSHTGAGGSQPFNRMTTAGYPFAAPYAAGENIAFSGTTGTLGGLASYIEDQHRGLFLSPSHRTNIENGSYREIGISQVTGAFTSGTTTYNASMVTQNFAFTGTTSFLGGVIYNDLDLDNFYDPGEGVAGVTIRINGTPVATSTAAGAYYLPLANGTHALQMDGGNLPGVFTSTVTMAGLNLQVNARSADFAPATAHLAIAATNANRAEGNGGTTGFTFTVSRNGSLALPSTATWSVAGIAGAGTQLASATDFAGNAFPTGTVSFAPGESTRTLTIPVLADTLGESNERFAVTLATPSAGTTLAAATATGIIRNDDTSLALSANLSRAEGNSGTTAYTFTVARAGTTLPAGTVAWSVTGGGVSGTVAANAADFVGNKLPTGTLSFAIGQTSLTITIPVAGDTNTEGGYNESFTLSLSNPTAGMTLARATATGLIREDDAIRGTNGNDTLIGTAAPDLFIIGQGQDSITGGAGTDTFRFLPTALGATNQVSIQDFTRAANERLDLSSIDAIATTLANDAFTFIGTAPFSGTPGELRWEDQGTTRLIQANTNTTPAADLTILLTAPGPIDATWFVL
jgi:hypothetical protein